MNILLLSMPDSFEHTAPVTMRMPNGALASLAGNVDAHHRVAIADLILVQRRVRETVERLMREHRSRRGRAVDHDVPARHGAEDRARWSATLKPRCAIVVGGYDPSLAPEVYEDPAWDVDVIVRGEGDITFRELLRALEAGRDRRRCRRAVVSQRGRGSSGRRTAAGQHARRRGGAAAEPRGARA